MIAKTPSCPSCASERIIKNGCIHNGKQNHKCKNCGRQFVEDSQKAGSARVADVSEPWLQSYVNRKYEAVPKRVESRPKKGDA